MSQIGCNSALPSLPNEMLNLIFSYCTDLPTAVKSIQAVPILEVLFKDRYRTHLLRILQGCLPLQIQKIVSAILAIRHGRLDAHKTSAGETVLEPKVGQSLLIDHLPMPRDATQSQSSCKPLEAGLDFYLEKSENPCEIPPLDHPSSALQDIAMIHQDVEDWTYAFLSSCCRCPRMTADDLNQPLRQEIQTSPTEFYRIHRAFWRFWLLCDLVYPQHEAPVQLRRPILVSVFSNDLLTGNSRNWSACTTFSRMNTEGSELVLIN